MTRLPMRTYWMLALTASLALHAGVLAAGFHLLGSDGKPAAETEIRFAAAPEAAILKSASPDARLTAAPAETEIAASMAPAERLAPAQPDRAAPLAAERLEPAEPERAAPISPETAAPVSDPAPAERPVPAERAAPQPAETAAAVPSPERLAAVEPERAVAVAPESLAPRAGAADGAEPALGSERLGAAPPAEPTAPAVSAERATAGSAAAETLSPASAAESLPALAPERGEPAPAERLAALPAIAADPAPPERATEAPTERLASVAPEREIGVALQPERVERESGAALAAAESLAPSAPAAAERLVPNRDAAADGEPAAAADAASGMERLAPSPSPLGTSPRIAATAGGAESAAPAARPDVEAIRPIEPAAPAGDAVASGAGGRTEAPIAPRASAGETIAPSGGERETVTASLFQPSLPGSALRVDPEKPTDLYGRAVDFVGSFEGGDCFVALPSVDSEGGVAFKAFGKDADREKAFATAYRRAIGLDAAISLGDINAAQCAAIGFARGASGYPRFGLILDLDRDDVVSGQTVIGAIRNGKWRELHLLIVDDEGRVQGIDSLLEPEPNGNDRGFAIEVHLTGGPVATKQLLIAISSDRALPLLGGQPNTVDVEAFFRDLEQQVSTTGASIDIAIAGFSVEPDPAADAGR